eukprot:4387251-Pyramimonas_sp.AAC.1
MNEARKASGQTARPSSSVAPRSNMLSWTNLHHCIVAGCVPPRVCESVRGVCARVMRRLISWWLFVSSARVISGSGEEDGAIVFSARDRRGGAAQAGGEERGAGASFGGCEQPEEAAEGGGRRPSDYSTAIVISEEGSLLEGAKENEGSPIASTNDNYIL